MTFDEWLDDQDWSQIATVVVCGLGADGGRAHAIRERTDANILIYEPREDLRALFSSRPKLDHCTVSASPTMLRGRIYVANHDISGDMLVVSDSDDPPEMVEDLDRAHAEASLSSQMRDVSVVQTAHTRVSHMLGSLDRFVRHPPINHLFNCLDRNPGGEGSVPAVIVGAGPSLDKNIELLRAHRDRCVIIAVNSSWPALHRAGIVPDFVVVCEAKPVSSTLSGLPFDRVICIPGIHVHSSIYDLPWRRIAPALSPEGMFGEWACRIFGLPTIPIGPSAVCLGLGMAWLLGCDPLILVGCDCAPREDGQLYAEGSAFAGTTVQHLPTGGSLIVKSDAKIGVEDLPGVHQREWCDATVSVWNWAHDRKINSVMTYDSIRQWMEEFAERASHLRRCVNATEGGAFTGHWEHTRLADVLPELPRVAWHHEDGRELSCPDMVVGALDLASEDAPDAAAATEQALLEQIDGEDRARVLAQEAVRLCVEGQRLCARLGDIQREIGSIHGLELLDAYNWGRVEQARRKGDRPVFDVFREVFAEGERGIAELKPQLAVALERVKEAAHG